jgi:hypothetical protein
MKQIEDYHHPSREFTLFTTLKAQVRDKNKKLPEDV